MDSGVTLRGGMGNSELLEPVPKSVVVTGGSTVGLKEDSLLPIYGEQHEVFREHVQSVSAQWTPDVVAQWEADGHLPSEVFATLGREGFFRTRWQAGALEGLPFALVMVEELYPRCSGLALGAMLHSENFLGTLNALAESPSQRSVYESALDGASPGCFAITEPQAGSDIVRGIQTTATRTEHGWRLKGEKRFISNSGTASHGIILAQTGAGPPGSPSGAGLFLVPLDSPGVEVIGFYPKAGTLACDLGHIKLNVELDKDAVLGNPGAGFLYANRALQLERISIGGLMVAAARTSIRLAVAFARRRNLSAGRLMDMQAIRHRLAEATIDLQTTKSFLHTVVSAAMANRDVNHETAALKLQSARMAGRVVDECLQVFGGRGYTQNYPLQGYWRDVRLARIGAGSDEAMLEVISAAIDRASPEYDAWIEQIEADDLPMLD